METAKYSELGGLRNRGLIGTPRRESDSAEFPAVLANPVFPQGPANNYERRKS